MVFNLGNGSESKSSQSEAGALVRVVFVQEIGYIQMRGIWGWFSDILSLGV